MEGASRSDSPQYRIGAVSRLTGIPTDTLRIWERRYGVVEPQRAEGGNRLYSQDDISRLALIKRLVDTGHAIGTIANLTLPDLRARLASASALPAQQPAASTCRVVVLGDTLPARMAEETALLAGLNLVGTYQDGEQFERDAANAAPDVAIMEIATVHEDTVADVRRLLRRSSAQHGLVVYGFGSRPAIGLLEQAGVSLVKAPVDLGELRRLCMPFAGASAARSEAGATVADTLLEPLPARRYSNDELARFASTSTSVKCECPHHLADLVMSLAAFENYSAECENRSPDDAALHAYLHATTARARSMMEEALARVAEAEGLDV